MSSMCSKGWSVGLNRFAGLKSQSENEIESEFPQLTFFFILIMFLALNKKTSCLRVFVPSCQKKSRLRVCVPSCQKNIRAFVS